MMPVCFAYNPTSWRNGALIPGGMADCLVQPILPYLTAEYILTNTPQPGALNVYYAHRSKYPTQREPGIRSVFVSHGIADKRWRDAYAVSSRFHYTAVSGPAWTRKLVGQGMNPRKILEVGYTKLDPIFNHKIEPPQRDSRIRVLWAPTHGGGGEHRRSRPGTLGGRATSWWDREYLLGLLPESDFDVVVAPHPRHRPDRRSTLTEYVGADVVIADGGSTIYEAWALDLPVVFCDWLTGHANSIRHGGQTFEAHIYREQLGYHAHAPEDLPRCIEHAAHYGIGELETEFIETILPRAYRGNSGRLHAEALDDIAKRAVPRHQPRTTYVFFERPGFRLTQRVKAVAGSPAAEKYARSPLWTAVDA